MSSIKESISNIKNYSLEHLQQRSQSKHNNQYQKKHKRVKTFTQKQSFNILNSPLNRLKFQTERKFQNIKTQPSQFRSSKTYNNYNSQFGVCIKSLKNIDINECKAGQRIAKFKYNKYYIHPDNRLKRVMTQGSTQIQEKMTKQTSRTQLGKLKKLKKQQERDKIYNKLYYEHYQDQQKPFKLNKNKRFQIIQKLATDNIPILQKFSKEMIQLKRRIPKIVQIIMEKKKNKIKSMRKQ